jgi:hypothetical protein
MDIEFRWNFKIRSRVTGSHCLTSSICRLHVTVVAWSLATHCSTACTETSLLITNIAVMLMSTQSTSFLARWRTLPTELQLQVLTHVVTIEPSGRWGDLKAIARNQNNRYWNSNASFTNIIVPLLACAEIKDLVLEAFYTHNYFLLAYSGIVWSTRARKVMLLPPQPMQKFIRKMHICLEYAGLTEINLLEKAARATKKLTALTFLDITFFSLRLPLLMPPKPDKYPVLCFESKCLRVSYQHLKVAHERVLDKFVLSTSATEEPPATRWTRVAYRYLESDPICPSEARSDLALRRKQVSTTDNLAVFFD